MYRDIATTLYKRATQDSVTLPSWAPALFFLNFVLLLLPAILVTYTLQHVYPTLAMVEDPAPPAYDPIALNEDAQFSVENGTRASGAAAPPVLTASIRSTHRAVYAAGGWRSLFRGFWAYVFLNIVRTFVAVIFIGIGLPPMASIPLVALILVQPYAAWTHTIIAAPSTKGFFKRFPPFKKAFNATALPVLFYILAKELSVFAPHVLMGLLGMNAWNPKEPNSLPKAGKDDVWKTVLVLLSALALHICLVVPTQVVLVRVQASFLPEDEDTIVPFDRTFGGKVEPAIVSGKGYVNMVDAFKSFSRASWIRLIKLYVKIFFIGIAFTLFCVAILIPEYILIVSASTKTGDL